MKNDKRILEFFGGKLEFVSFLNRINNEFSHGENQPDRLFKPIDIPEFKKVWQLLFLILFYETMRNSIMHFWEV